MIKGTAHKNNDLELSYRKFSEHTTSKKREGFSASSVTGQLRVNILKRKGPCPFWDHGRWEKDCPLPRGRGDQHRAALEVQRARKSIRDNSEERL